MKLIIDIDEQYYKDLKKITPYVCSEAITAIQKGTPLPEGHGRLVDADKIKFNSDDFFDCGDAEIAEEVVNEAPTIIETDKEEY